MNIQTQDENKFATTIKKIGMFIARLFVINSLQVLKALRYWLLVIFTIGALISFAVSGNPDPVVAIEKGRVAAILGAAVISTIPTWLGILLLWNVFHPSNFVKAWKGKQPNEQ